MNTLLKKLWYSYITECDLNVGSEEKQILERLVAHEAKLLDGMDEKQLEIYKMYCEDWNELQSVLSCEAFIKGVRFATSFWAEAKADHEIHS